MLNAWVALNSVVGLGPVRIKNLIERFGTPDEIFKQSPQTIARERIIPEICITQLFNKDLMRQAEEQVSKTDALGIQIMTLSDPDYPFYLKEIYAPPPVLYIKGLRSIFKEHAIAIVGTRSPTYYGKTATKLITQGLVDCNMVIVSGLARGIDTVGHESCLLQNGYTIAVLGSGIDYIYPKSNEQLAEKICAHGAIVSEFPLGTPPVSFNFPRRNRIISGLAAGVIVIEAGTKSGSLITAHYALQQGRDVFAVPGPINSPMSNGTFNLIKEGAIPARCGKEIADSLMVISNPIVRIEKPQLKISIDIMSDDEKKVYDYLSDIPLRIDELADHSGIAITELLCTLLNLELKGLVNQSCGQLFTRI